ncbi:MAG: 16S rRNA (guanine(527)-N(7))-methyltransferase RsmG [Spirochaetes bacterium]|nr:16S rRNA (guanine(527)-N(7))-methyltransferase RsmG [Spirochaetota bacterium]
MFHVERDIIQKWLKDKNIRIKDEIEDKMLRFADMIHSANQKFNLTGLKTRTEILTELILRSLDPVCDIIVPRGTRFADIGSGAGIPGVPLAIFFSSFSGTLIESSKKKTEFIKSAVEELGLAGINVICDRAEEIAAGALHREQYDWVFARAFGKLYITLELAAPFVKQKGYLYIYSTIVSEQIPAQTLNHSDKLGINIMSHKQMGDIKLSKTGLCFKKEKNTPNKYPRKYPIIKREAEKA